MSFRAVIALVMPAAAVIAAPAAYATVYLSVDQAQRAMFPAAAEFVARPIDLGPAQRQAIARAVGSSPKRVMAWEARSGGRRLGWFLLDKVLGKHENITYAVAVDPQGRVTAIEILEYRETYGGEIRNPRWRAQFFGKSAASPVSLGQDIKNISGATISCRNVTKGVKRLLTAFQVAVAGT